MAEGDDEERHGLQGRRDGSRNGTPELSFCNARKLLTSLYNLKNLTNN